MSDLEDRLTDIPGVGPKTAQAIIETVDAETGIDPALVQRAYDKLQKGRKDLALNALERALDE